MVSEISMQEKDRNSNVVVEIQASGSEKDSKKSSDFQVEKNLFTSNSNPSLLPDLSAKRPIRSANPKLKSRIAEPPYPKKLKGNAQIDPSKSLGVNSSKMASPSLKANSGTPRTPLMASIRKNDDDDDEDDDEVYKTENLKFYRAKPNKKMKAVIMIEWFVFICTIALLISSLTINKLRDFDIWSVELWKWCVMALVIFCGRLMTEWLSNLLVFLIEKNFLLKKKVLYFLFALKKSVRIVVWLVLILVVWVLLINRGVKRSNRTDKILNLITRFIVSNLIGSVLWTLKTLSIKLIASSFHVRTFFDRIQESLFHQYVLQALSGAPLVERDVGCKLCFDNLNPGNNEKNEEVIDVDKLYKMKKKKVSYWTMVGLVKVIRNSGLPSISEALEDSVEEELEEKKEIASEVEAKDSAKRIFRNVAKHGHKYIEEDDLLLFMPKDKVDEAFPLFEGATESRRIKKSSFKDWVVKAYNERKILAVSLNDAKTAIEELNKISSAVILLVIVIVWLLLMEIATTKILVFISSQLLLIVFMFGNTARMVFEAIIFIFVVHPFDVGDRCVVDGVQMVVDEMNIMTTIFLKGDNEKISYPNSVLAIKAISNFNRSPEMMGDSVEFAVDFSTSVESIAELKTKVKAYLESKPQHWRPGHSVQIKEIDDVNKLQMALYVTHTINFQNAGEKANRRSDLVLEIKKIFEEIGIKYRLLPQPVQISYVGEKIPITPANDAES